MRKRRIPEYLITWVDSFTSDRSHCLSFDNRRSQPFPFPNALPPGSPSSPALFAIMMAAILEIKYLNLSNLAYADHMNESASAVSITSATFELGKRFQQYSSGATQISLSFDPKKTDLMHLSTNRRPKTDTSIPLPIQSSTSL
jgi:hypothetical protein